MNVLSGHTVYQLKEFAKMDNQPKFNFVAIIGCAIGVASFGFNSVAGYARLEARLAVLEYQIQQVISTSSTNREILKRLDEDIKPKR